MAQARANSAGLSAVEVERAELALFKRLMRAARATPLDRLDQAVLDAILTGRETSGAELSGRKVRAPAQVDQADLVQSD